MVKPVVLVVGLGEVGHSLYELLKQSRKFDLYCFDVDEQKMKEIVQDDIPTKLDILYICYSCGKQEEFVKITVDYINKFKSELTIINSTVPPGTTKKVYKITGGNLVHSPIRGMHSSLQTMKRDLLFWTKFVGGIDQKSAELAQKHFEELGLKTKVLSGPTETELAKLFSTTYRAWMIACFQEMHRISSKFEADFTQIIEFLQDTHFVRHDRPIHFPGVIGGHCLIPNTELLSKNYDSEFLKLILKSNQKRKLEMEDPKIAREVERIQEKVKSLEEKTIKMK
ncbi:MAG: GDP-mannose dehydrogenase [Candidatus Bathyarchaeota archaeon]|nr:GDP-mannose dehydrogenase [Candidatus Bathyarchaeum tardum]